MIAKKAYGSTQPFQLLRLPTLSDAIVSYGKDTRLIFPGYTVVDYIQTSVKWPCQYVINHVATEPMRIEKRAKNDGYDRVALPYSIPTFVDFIDALTEQLNKHMDSLKPKTIHVENSTRIVSAKDNIAQFM